MKVSRLARNRDLFIEFSPFSSTVSTALGEFQFQFVSLRDLRNVPSGISQSASTSLGGSGRVVHDSQLSRYSGSYLVAAAHLPTGFRRRFLGSCAEKPSHDNGFSSLHSASLEVNVAMAGGSLRYVPTTIQIYAVEMKR